MRSLRSHSTLTLVLALSAMGALASACKHDDAADSSLGGASSGGKATGGKGGGPAAGGHTASGGRSSAGGSAGNPSMGGEGGAAPTDKCLEPSGPGTEVPNSISDDQTWTHEGSPYVVPYSVILTGNLVLEECTVVRLAEGATLDVRGSLTARGTAVPQEGADPLVRPVLFAPLVPGEAWGSIDVSPEGRLDLEVAALTGGGAREATIHAWGEDQYGLPYRNVRTVSTYISGSVNPAVFMEVRAAFSDDSTDLVIESSGSTDVPFPIVIEAGTASALPSPLTLDGNLRDEILVVPFRPVQEETFKELGYPYVLDGQLVVAHRNSVPSDAVSSLTIEPGVTLRMLNKAGSGLFIGNGQDNFGRLIAEGTAAKPIRLESGLDETAPGDWLGVYFPNPMASGNSLKHVQIAHAGGFSGAQGFGCGPIENHASVLILNATPIEPFMENCTIESAGGDTQILLGWDNDGDPSAAASAFFEANTFDETGPECHVSLPQDATSQCPGDSQPDCL